MDRVLTPGGRATPPGRARRWRGLMCLWLAVVMGAALVAGLLGQPAYADSGNNMGYSSTGNEPGVGEAVMEGRPRVYLVFAGSQWGTQSIDPNGDLAFANDPVGAARTLQEFFKGLGTDDEHWSGIMTQYCDGLAHNAQICPTYGIVPLIGYPAGGALAGVWADEGAPAPDDVTGYRTADEAISASEHFGNTTAESNARSVYVVIWPHGIWPHLFNSSTCSMHQWQGNPGLGLFGNGSVPAAPPVAFIDLPYVSDHSNCMGKGGSTGFTIQAGHEYAETLTDPFVTFSPSLTTPFGGGWWGGDFTEEDSWFARGPWNDEIGDKCQSEPAVSLTLATGIFEVPELWSNSANGGAGACVSSGPIFMGGGITNGGFETGGLPSVPGSLFGWTATGQASAYGTPHSGTYAALLGAASSHTGDSTLTQQFTDGGGNYLSLWYNQHCIPGEYEWASANLHDNTTDTDLPVLPLTCTNGAGYVPASVQIPSAETNDDFTLTLDNHDSGSAADPAYTTFDDVALFGENGPDDYPAVTGVHLFGGGLTWDAPTQILYTPLTGYVIYKDGSPIGTAPAAAHSYEDTTYDATAAHTYQIRYYDTYARLSDPATVIQAPMNLHRAEQGQVCWDAVFGHSADSDGYHIFANGAQVDSVSPYYNPSLPVCWAPSSPVFTSWPTGSVHIINVSAYSSSAGNESDLSADLDYVYVPAPSSLTAKQLCIARLVGKPCIKQPIAVLQWNAVSKATGYNIYRNGSLLTSVSANSTSYQDTTATTGVWYSYTVTAQFNRTEGLAAGPAQTVIN